MRNTAQKERPHCCERPWIERQKAVTPYALLRLLDDLSDNAGADGTAALADSEAQALLHGDIYI